MHPEGEVLRVWLLPFIDHEPKEVHCTPAVSHAEVRTCYPLAAAAESIEANWQQRAEPTTAGHEQELWRRPA